MKGYVKGVRDIWRRNARNVDENESSTLKYKVGRRTVLALRVSADAATRTSNREGRHVRRGIGGNLISTVQYSTAQYACFHSSLYLSI